MKKLLLVLFSVPIALTSFSLSTSAQGINVHIGTDGIDIRPDAFVSYYHAPPESTLWLQRENIPELQWPLLFEIARAANVAPQRVWELRRQHPNWYDVLAALSVPASYFYYDVPATQQLSPPYGRAYGYYRNHPSEIVRWSDADLIKLASVKYIADSSRRPVHEAVVIYNKRPHFIRSNDIAVSKPAHHQERHEEDRIKHNRGHDKAKKAPPKKAKKGHSPRGKQKHGHK